MAAAGKESVSLSHTMVVNNLVVEEELWHHGHACSGGGCLAGKMEKRADEGLEEADFRNTDMETNEAWTDKHRNVTRKLVVEGGRVQKRLS